MDSRYSCTIACLPNLLSILTGRDHCIQFFAGAGGSRWKHGRCPVTRMTSVTLEHGISVAVHVISICSAMYVNIYVSRRDEFSLDDIDGREHIFRANIDYATVFTSNKTVHQNSIRENNVTPKHNHVFHAFSTFVHQETACVYIPIRAQRCNCEKGMSMQATASPDERRSFILKALQETGRLTTAQLSSHFDISEDSARRDFRELSAEGMIQRVHGAALPATSASQPFKSRYKVSSGTKARLAKLAAARIREGQVVLFDGGTTNLAVATQISKTLAFSAITSSPQIATALSESRNVEVILLGGVFDPRSQMTVGSAVLDAVQRVRADVCFTGVHGLDAEIGLTTPYYDEALTKAAMIAASSVVIAVATNDKIGFCAAHKISELDSVDLLIAERSESAHTQLEEIQHCGVEVVLG